MLLHPRLLWLLPLLLSVIAGIAVASRLFASLPDIEPLLAYRPALPTRVLDRAGRPFAQFAEQRRQLVRLGDIPPPVVRAFLAAEDASFFEHGGIDPSALLRAAWVNLRAGGRAQQGGSTITQQLAKSLIGTERTVGRKIRDMALALVIEARIEKSRILEIYLNEIYLGRGAYGVAQAARSYFDKSLDALTLSEAALLAGIVKAPSAFAPHVNPDAAETRRRYVLDQMRALGWLEEPAWRTASAERPMLRPPRAPEAQRAAAWFMEEVRRTLFERVGPEALLRGGLVVETTLDLALQERALAAVQNGVAAWARRRPGGRSAPAHSSDPGAEAALVALDVASGEVLALVGGHDFERSQFNRATQARRQPGSAFKPFVYGAALELGFQPWATLYDAQVRYYDPVRGKPWTPKNYSGRLLGAVPLEEAFARSLNNATIHLLSDVGVGRVIDFARRAGLRSPLAQDLGLALGTSGVSLAELVGAYRTFAAGGERRAPCFVRRVRDRDGRVLLADLSLLGDEPEAIAERAAAQTISPVDAYLVSHLLRGTVRHWYGTAHRASRLGPVAGKTGSTNENRDAWFIGFSPKLAAGVWVGNDQMESLGERETGAVAALPIWIEFMEAALAGQEPGEFVVPEGVRFAARDRESGEMQRSRIAIAGFQPYADGRRARRSSYVALPTPPEPAPLPVAEPQSGAAPPTLASEPSATQPPMPPVGAGPPAPSESEPAAP